MTTRESSMSIAHPVALAAALLLPVAVVVVWYAPGMGNMLLRLTAIALVAGTAGVVGLARPYWVALAMCFYVYAGAGGVPVLPLAPCMIAVLAATTFCRFAAGESAALVDRMFWWGLGVFLLMCLVSALFSFEPGVVLSHTMLYLKPIALAFFVVQFVNTPRRLRTLAIVLAIAGPGTVLLELVALRLGFIPASEIVLWDGVPRIAGLHDDANRAAGYMVASMPFTAYLASTARTRGWRVLAIVGFIATVLTVLLTMSRGAILGLAIVVAAVVVREFRSRTTRLAIAGLVILAIVSIPDVYTQRLSTLSRLADAGSGDGSLALRIAAVKAALRLFSEHPFTGIGLGTFLERADHLISRRVMVHNSFAEILVGCGIFGLIGFLTIYLAGFRAAIAASKHHWKTDPSMRSFAFYCGVSLFSTGASGLFLSMSYRYLLWIPLAAALVLGNLMRAERAPLSEASQS